MSKKAKKCTLTLSCDETLGYSWSRQGRSVYNDVVGGGGYETLLHMLLDVDLLKVLEHDLGPESVPQEIMEIAQNRAKREEMSRMPIPPSVIAGLKDLGYPVDDAE